MVTDQLKILLDGACPLCRREGSFLRWLDGERGRLVIEDISAPDFNPGRYGKNLDELMGQIHGVTPAGTLITGVEVFRRACDAAGWGWVLAPTRWPILRQISDRAYTWFARNRLRLTGRQDACEAGRCRLHPQ